MDGKISGNLYSFSNSNDINGQINGKLIHTGVLNKGEDAFVENIEKIETDVDTKDFEATINEFMRVCKGSIYVFCGIEQVSYIKKTFRENGLSTRLVIWEKSNPSPMNGDTIWLSSVECCVFGKFPKATFNEHCKSSVLRFPCGRNKLHPTQKPLDLFKRIVEVSSNEGDIVFDPFMGSGTAGEAALMLNRNFIGCELSGEYFELAENRVKEAEEKYNGLFS